MPNIPTAADLAAIQAAQKLEPVLHIIDEELAALNKVVMLNAAKEIRNGTLTPDKAMNYLMEVHSNNRLIQRLQSRVNAGRDKAENLFQENVNA